MDNLKEIVEGILFTMGDSVDPQIVANALEIDKKEVVSAIEELKADYENQKRGFRILKLEDSYQMCTAPELYEYLIKIAKQPKRHVLTDVLLETLAIVAYKQPVTRVDIETIRGVSSDHAVNKLIEYGLIEEIGRMDAPGRPMLFGTTEEFLRCFGVSDLEELPAVSQVQIEEFRQQAQDEVFEFKN